MILPIYIYGHPPLRRPTVDVAPADEGLEKLLQDMWETMYEADGIGLAAPQVGKSLRLFVVDASGFAGVDPACEGFKRAFINPRVIEWSTGQVTMTEGCLSIPGLHEEVTRPERVTIAYRDETGIERVETLDGMRARVVQHEYDHVEGRTFIDRLSPLKRRLLRGNLSALAAGKFKSDYRVVLPSRGDL